ncbi:hypothetical protein [Salipiger aestuarii]|nr:hypothetical protein [Salipiger aestuarii]
MADSELQIKSGSGDNMGQVTLAPLGEGLGDGLSMLETLLQGTDPALDIRQAQTLADALDGGSGPVLVVTMMPDRMLAQALAGGALPSQAVADWQTWADGQLALLRRARSRVLLLNEQALLTTPGVLTQALNQRLGCGFTDLPEPRPVPEDPQAPLHEILARHLLTSSPRLRAMAEELDASIVGSDMAVAADADRLDQAFAAAQSVPPSKPQPDLQPAEDTDALAASCQQLRNAVIELQHQLTDETVARDLLQADCDAMEIRIATLQEQAKLREAALGEEVLRLGREADDLREKTTSLRGGSDDRLRMLELELAAADETRRTQAGLVDAQQKDIDAQNNRLVALQGELDQARSELDHIHRSKSWAIAGAIRSIRYGFRK